MNTDYLTKVQAYRENVFLKVELLGQSYVNFVTFKDFAKLSSKEVYQFPLEM